MCSTFLAVFPVTKRFHATLLGALASSWLGALHCFGLPRFSPQRNSSPFRPISRLPCKPGHFVGVCGPGPGMVCLGSESAIDEHVKCFAEGLAQSFLERLSFLCLLASLAFSSPLFVGGLGGVKWLWLACRLLLLRWKSQLWPGFVQVPALREFSAWNWSTCVCQTERQRRHNNRP